MEDTVSNLTEATYNDNEKIMRNINLILIKEFKNSLGLKKPHKSSEKEMIIKEI